MIIPGSTMNVEKSQSKYELYNSLIYYLQANNILSDTIPFDKIGQLYEYNLWAYEYLNNYQIAINVVLAALISAINRDKNEIFFSYKYDNKYVYTYAFEISPTCQVVEKPCFNNTILL